MDHAANIDTKFRGFTSAAVLPLASYLVLVLACFGLIIGYYIYDPFGFESPKRDTWHHIAVLGELIANPFDPSNPHIPTEEPSRYYSPLAVLAGIFGKLFSLSSWQIFNFISTLTCLGFIASCWLFGKKYYQSAWAPFLLVLSLLFAWGQGMGHAGFHNISTFGSRAAYPATQALVLGIFSWYLALLAMDHKKLVSPASIGLLIVTAVMFLTHQFSGVIMAFGAGSFILFHQSANLQHKMKLLFLMALSGLLTLFWPYFNPLDVVFSAADPKWKSDVTQTDKLSYILAMIAPALAGVLGFKNKNSMRWEVALPAVVFTSFFILFYSTEMSIAHRIPPAIILYLQLGLVWVFITFGHKLKQTPVLAVVISVVAASIILGNLSFANHPRVEEPLLREKYGRMIVSAKAMASHVPAHAIAFASDSIVYPYQATGRRVVSIPRPEPVAPSLPQRQEATARFFAEDTNQSERSALITKWEASYIVFSPKDLSPVVMRELREFGPSEKFTRDVEIIAITAHGEAL